MYCDLTEEELQARARDERDTIIKRYARGRTPENLIDDWEDPNYELLCKIDRYGFIHAEDLPLREKHEEQQILMELQREAKWLKMLKKWDKKENKDKLGKRIFKGIPNKLRPPIWKKLLNIDKLMRMEGNQNVYQRMLIQARNFSTDIRQIDSDVNRQFRDHINYRERYSIKQQSLFNVLIAYSMYNMEVGYCQGMSTLAGVLLLFMDEEEAFWALAVLLTDKKFAMHGLFIEGFPKLMRLLAHHDKILTKFLPKLKKHFDKNGLDAVLYSLKWFFVIFIERIPFSLCLRVLDLYLWEGERIVTAMAYTILKMHRDKLLKFKDMDQMTEYLQYKLCKNFGYSDNFVIKSLEQSLIELKNSKYLNAPPAPQSEFPKFPLGQYIEPTNEQKSGLRKSMFTDNEKTVTDYVITRQENTENLDENCNVGDTDGDEAINTGDCTISIRTYKSMNSVLTTTSRATSTNSVSFEINQHDLDDDEDFVFLPSMDETTRL